MAFKLTNPTHKKRKVTKRKSLSKTDTKEPNAFVTLDPGFTNFTPIKKKPSRGKLSSKTIIQELEALESLSVEELLRNVQTLEESLQDLPSIEDTIAEVERLTEQMEKELEEYLNEVTRKMCLVSKERERQEKKHVEFCNEHPTLVGLSENALRPVIQEKDSEIKELVIEQIVDKLEKKPNRITQNDVTEIIENTKAARYPFDQRPQVNKLPIYFPFSKIFRKIIPLHNRKTNLEIVV